MRPRLAPLAAALALAACSGSVNPKDLDPYAGAEQGCRALMDAIFSQAARCGMSQPFAESLFDAAVGRCAGLDRPDVALDLPAFQGCVERLATAACWEDLEDLCPGVQFTGTVPAGGACAGDADCAPGLEGCFSPEGTCGGTCRAYGRDGEGCGAAQDPPCEDGLRCDETQTCRPLLGAGGFCAFSTDCQDGLRCQGTCEPVLGTACQSEVDCVTRDPQAYYCPLWEPATSAERACRRAADDQDPGRCTGDGDVGGGKPCPGDQWCDPQSLQCQPRTLTGPCTGDDQCLAPAYCQKLGGAITWECQVPVKIGGGCVVGLHECELGAWCSGAGLASAGTCRAWSGLGGTCGAMDGGELAGCVDGYCKLTGSGERGTCSPRSSVGATCVDSEECGVAGDLGDAACVDGLCVKACGM